MKISESVVQNKVDQLKKFSLNTLVADPIPKPVRQSNSVNRADPRNIASDRLRVGFRFPRIKSYH